MTFAELRAELKELKKVSDVCINLFSEYKGNFENIGLYITEDYNKWKVYYTERGSKDLICIFNSEHDVCEYIFCYFKQWSDHNRWF